MSLEIEAKITSSTIEAEITVRGQVMSEYPSSKSEAKESAEPAPTEMYEGKAEEARGSAARESRGEIRSATLEELHDHFQRKAQLSKSRKSKEPKTPKRVPFKLSAAQTHANMMMELLEIPAQEPKAAASAPIPPVAGG